MGFIKTFMLGAAVAYGIQYITKKRSDGTSILSDLKEDPSRLINQAKDYANEKIGQVTDNFKQQATT
jgi:hypothetical protein